MEQNEASITRYVIENSLAVDFNKVRDSWLADEVMINQRVVVYEDG